jgi:hypothetical protein
LAAAAEAGGGFGPVVAPGGQQAEVVLQARVVRGRGGDGGDEPPRLVELAAGQKGFGQRQRHGPARLVALAGQVGGAAHQGLGGVLVGARDQMGVEVGPLGAFWVQLLRPGVAGPGGGG